nr:MAG TPA: hypothetical protein [Caudoviricetes sp.]
MQNAKLHRIRASNFFMIVSLLLFIIRKSLFYYSLFYSYKQVEVKQHGQ